MEKRIVTAQVTNAVSYLHLFANLLVESAQEDDDDDDDDGF